MKGGIEQLAVGVGHSWYRNHGLDGCTQKPRAGLATKHGHVVCG
jgi:hypothetical protein